MTAPLYCDEDDLLVTGPTTPGDKSRFIQIACDDMDSKMGYLYVTPIDLAALPTFQAKLIKTIALKLASGRLLMAAAMGQENQAVNAYAAYLCKEAEIDLMGVANGTIDLTAPRVDDSGSPIGTIPDPSVTDPYARVPTATNPDQTSAVTSFEKRFMQPATIWPPFGPPYPAFVPDENIKQGDRNVRPY